ncbi:MAG: hypothetical protein ABI401_01090 [Candidatus Dormibacter sp.]
MPMTPAPVRDQTAPRATYRIDPSVQLEQVPALSDDIVTSSKFRTNLSTHLDRARRGGIVTVMVNGSDDDMVAVIERRALSALFKRVRDLSIELEAVSETNEILSDPATMQALARGLAQADSDDGVSPNALRAKLGWPAKSR